MSSLPLWLCVFCFFFPKDYLWKSWPAVVYDPRWAQAADVFFYFSSSSSSSQCSHKTCTWWVHTADTAASVVTMEIWFII